MGLFETLPPRCEALSPCFSWVAPFSPIRLVLQNAVNPSSLASVLLQPRSFFKVCPSIPFLWRSSAVDTPTYFLLFSRATLIPRFLVFRHLSLAATDETLLSSFHFPMCIHLAYRP